MGTIEHRDMVVNGVRLHVAEQGEGPLVLLLHGFPECWYSWRHQFEPLATAGYRVVAPDQRGYARSDCPDGVDEYTIMHLAGDVIGLLDAYGAQRAVLVGHDWGALVAWQTALLRPDRIAGVAGLSVPYHRRSPTAPNEIYRERYGDGFYQLYFQQPGVADAELARDPRSTFRRLLWSWSGDSSVDGGPVTAGAVLPPGSGLVDATTDPPQLPGWLTDEDVDTYVAEFAKAGFTGGLNWYRNNDRNWAITAPWHTARLIPPALYLTGDRDPVLHFSGGRERVLRSMQRSLVDLRRVTVLPGCGHWVQQERPGEVNDELVRFLNEVSAG